MTAPSLAHGLLKHSSTIALATAVLAAPVHGQFTSGVSVVEVYATVTDERGEVVKDLTRADFEVLEDGRPQEISAFVAGDFPLTIAVAIDRSFSVAGDRLAAARTASRAFLDLLRPDDQVVILAVGSRVDVVAPLSTDRAAQRAALSSIDTFGTTGLYDAVIEAIDLTAPGKGRRVLLLISDGGDRYSKATADDALRAARSSDVMIYPVAIGRERPAVFSELAAVSGGQSFHVREPKRLSETLERIASDLKHQYLIGYTPSRPIATGADRSWRSIQVEVDRPRVRVRARDGYIG
jgi:Ca-activated chloride channel family protein